MENVPSTEITEAFSRSSTAKSLAKTAISSSSPLATGPKNLKNFLPFLRFRYSSGIPVVFSPRQVVGTLMGRMDFALTLALRNFACKLSVLETKDRACSFLSASRFRITCTEIIINLRNTLCINHKIVLDASNKIVSTATNRSCFILR